MKLNLSIVAFRLYMKIKEHIVFRRSLWSETLLAGRSHAKAPRTKKETQRFHPPFLWFFFALCPKIPQARSAPMCPMPPPTLPNPMFLLCLCVEIPYTIHSSQTSHSSLTNVSYLCRRNKHYGAKKAKRKLYCNERAGITQ